MGKKRFDRVRGSRAREIVSAVHYAAQNAPDKVFYSGDIIELKDGTQDVVKEKLLGETMNLRLRRDTSLYTTSHQARMNARLSYLDSYEAFTNAVNSGCGSSGRA
ncbi:MAG: hypothetical protein R3B69_01805 [Candidatus Paceibacterota bacterium]